MHSLQKNGFLDGFVPTTGEWVSSNPDRFGDDAFGKSNLEILNELLLLE